MPDGRRGRKHNPSRNIASVKNVVDLEKIRQLKAVLADPPFDKELEDSGYHPNTLDNWKPGVIYRWLKESVVSNKLLAQDDTRMQLLRQLADQYYIQLHCRYLMENDGLEAKLGSRNVMTLLSSTQKSIREILKVFGVGVITRNADDIPGSPGAGSNGEDLPDSAFS